MKKIVLLLAFIFGVCKGYGQEDEEKYPPIPKNPVLQKFVTDVTSKVELQAKANTYIRTTRGAMVYLWNKRNQWSPYIPRYNYFEKTYLSGYIVSDEDMMERLYKKSLARYFKGLNPEKEEYSSIGCIHYTDPVGIIKETMLTIYVEEPGITIPVEVYERLEAEMLESGIYMNIDKRMMRWTKSDFYLAGSLITVPALIDYGKASEAKYYTNDSIREVLSLNYHQIHHPQHQDIVFKVVQNAYKLLWDTATFAYFTPEIISRVIVDVEYPEYRRIQGGYEYRDGDIAALLLPFDQRTFKKDKLDKRVYDPKSALFQILFNPKRYEDLSDLDFALAYTQKLVQAYLSYELIIDARIDPKVKDYLEKTNWFEGNFRQTLEYYAQLRGVALDTLMQKYIEEITSVLLPLDLCDEETLRFALREQLKE